MNLNDISTQLLFTTVPLWIRKPQGAVTGTGFIYNVPMPSDPSRSIPLLVTNFHVVEGATEGIIELVERSGDQPVLSRRVRAQIDPGVLLARTDSRLDIALVPLGPLLNQLDSTGRPVFFRSVGPEIIPAAEVISDLAALEEIVFIGYPSGLRDEHNSTPLIRRGITASPVWNDFGNEPVFLIDAGVYPGSSGSPVFIMNQGAYTTKSGLVVGSRLLFLGLITSTLLRTETTGNAYLGLGRVVKSLAIKTAIDAFAETIR
jgi:S1-C subfamily serine protease